MADFDKEFFEGVKDGVTKGKIEYINIAGISPEVAELRHVKFRLPASKMHMNHVGMVYAGSYFVFVEATGASLIKCTYGSTYVPIIKNMSLDYKKPCTGDHTHTPEVCVVLCGEGGVEKAHGEAQRVGVAGVGGEMVDEVNGTEEELR